MYFNTRTKSKLYVPCTGNRMRPVVKHDSKSDCPFYKKLLEGEARHGLAFIGATRKMDLKRNAIGRDQLAVGAVSRKVRRASSALRAREDASAQDAGQC
jgi:hypothetical protein